MRNIVERAREIISVSYDDKGVQTEMAQALLVAVEALQMYADPGIYDHIHTARIGVNNECGERARAALKKIGVSE